MARGWESKAVEDQMAEAEARRTEASREPLSEAEQTLKTRRAELSLARARALEQLQTACNAHHRASIEQSLAFLDAELQALDTHLH